MLPFFFILALSCLLPFFLPYALRVLHPLEILFLWMLTTSLAQFTFAVFIVNLQYLSSSGSYWDFAALKLNELVVVPQLAIVGIAALLSRNLSRFARISALLLTPMTIWLLYVFLMKHHVLVPVRWRDSYEFFIKFGWMSLLTGSAYAYRNLLRHKRVLT